MIFQKKCFQNVLLINTLKTALFWLLAITVIVILDIGAQKIIVQYSLETKIYEAATIDALAWFLAQILISLFFITKILYSKNLIRGKNILAGTVIGALAGWLAINCCLLFNCLPLNIFQILWSPILGAFGATFIIGTQRAIEKKI